jgi:hypothetical protein
MTNTELSGGDAVLRVAVLEQQVAALEAEKARQQAVPSGWVPLLIEYDPGYPEEVAFGPQRMMDRLKLWLDKYFAMLAAAPQADSSPLLAKLDISGIGRDAGHPRAVLLYLRHEPSDDDLRTIQEMFRTAYPAPAPAERVEQQAVPIIMPPSPYLPDAEPGSMTAYEEGEAQGRCDMWAEVKRLNTAAPQELPVTAPHVTAAMWSAAHKSMEVDGDLALALQEALAVAHSGSPAPAAPDVAGLVEALRQYRHNDGSDGFVFGYDKEMTDRYVAGLAQGGAADLERIQHLVDLATAAHFREMESRTAGLVEALRSVLGWRELRSGNDFPVERIEQIARAALATFHREG